MGRATSRDVGSPSHRGGSEYGSMYGHRSRRVKTDRRDVAALAEACRRGIYRCEHRRSPRQRMVQWHLNVRRELLDARTRLISVVGAITRSQGYRIARGATDTFLTRLAARELPESVRESLVPVRSVMELLTQKLADADRRCEALVGEDPIVKRLTTCPSVGPMTATAVVAALDNVHRFAGRRGAA